MIAAVLDQFVGQLPILLVAVAGAVVAVVMIQRTRVGALLALLGCVVLLGHVVLVALAGVLPRWLGLGGRFDIFMDLAAGLAFAVGVALVIAAAWVGRTPGGPRS